MSQENVDSYWRGKTAFNDGDWDGALATMDPDVEWDVSRVSPEMETRRGYEELKAFWRMLGEVWGMFRNDPEEVIDAGDKLFARNRLRGTGTASGVAVEDVLYEVISVRDGRAARVEYFRDRTEALEAAGLSE